MLAPIEPSAFAASSPDRVPDPPAEALADLETPLAQSVRVRRVGAVTRLYGPARQRFLVVLAPAPTRGPGDRVHGGQVPRIATVRRFPRSVLREGLIGGRRDE
jgi:hypothetical protein